MQRVLLKGTLLLYPIAYGFTHVLVHYRFPIDPLMTLAATSAVLTALAGLRRPRWNRAADSG